MDKFCILQGLNSGIWSFKRKLNHGHPNYHGVIAPAPESSREPGNRTDVPRLQNLERSHFAYPDAKLDQISANPEGGDAFQVEVRRFEIDCVSYYGTSQFFTVHVMDLNQCKTG